MDDTKLEVFKLANGDVRVCATMGPVFIETMHRQLEAEIKERVAQALADQFIKDKGTAIIATIDLKDVLNSAVAKVVTRLSEESRK